MQKMEIDKIIVKKRKRAVGDVDQLVESIKDTGLINPVTVDKACILIAGYHRLEACKKLGWQKSL
jgi:ParB family transcriptional regulator, chromosome partitioning protein